MDQTTYVVWLREYVTHMVREDVTSCGSLRHLHDDTVAEVHR
ncbi:hypothetical protein HSB1_03250 [Halogranum salarium B-1]|uniref:Uncharacterized protein n=1 Tax=Halogranum salarium B-1 TaxID=1210908 RepID=J3JHT7_9EURY|nr:hypothetical protein HSB1_03250 [Halogranum salarium B-1]